MSWFIGNSDILQVFALAPETEERHTQRVILRQTDYSWYDNTRNLEGEHRSVAQREDGIMETVRQMVEGPMADRTTIRRTKLFPVFFLALGFILLTIGFCLVLLSARIIITYGASGLVVLALAGVELAVSIFLVRWKASLLRPATITFDTDRIQYLENGDVKKEIRWDSGTEIRPQFNHMLGFNAYCGFSVSNGKTTIAASPDEGWPLGDLKSAIWPILAIALEKNVRISKDFKLIKWIVGKG
ncbi:MAG: hypothetical protein V3V98_09220 [Thermoplasmata archaeon]